MNAGQYTDAATLRFLIQGAIGRVRAAAVVYHMPDVVKQSALKRYHAELAEWQRLCQDYDDVTSLSAMVEGAWIPSTCAPASAQPTCTRP